MLDFGFYNMDCMEGMKQFPDNYFDLAIVDPPYGDGGGTWKRQDKSRFGGVFDKYRKSGIPRKVLPDGRNKQDSDSGSTGTSSTKKSFRGMLPRSRNISMNCFASHGTK